MTDETSDNPWPAKLRELRKRLGLTQKEAAGKVLVCPETWCRWERGKNPLSARAIMLIGLAFGKLE